MLFFSFPILGKYLDFRFPYLDKYLDLSLPGVETPPDTPQSREDTHLIMILFRPYICLCRIDRNINLGMLELSYYSNSIINTKMSVFCYSIFVKVCLSDILLRFHACCHPCFKKFKE